VRARDEALQWPPGVTLRGRRLCDAVASFEVELEQEEAEQLQRVVGSQRGGERSPSLDALLDELNVQHMLNFTAPSWFSSAARAPRRLELNGRLGSTLAQLLRGLGWLARGQVLFFAFVVVASAGAAAEALGWGDFGPARIGRVFGVAAAHGLVAYILHEAFHALAAVVLRAPAYLLVDRGGLSVWAQLAGRRSAARAFAAAGPLAPTLVGLALVLSVDVGTDWERVSYLGAYLLHAVALTPLCHDGRVIWSSAAADAAASTEGHS
jgi:hypothetical protein